VVTEKDTPEKIAFNDLKKETAALPAPIFSISKLPATSSQTLKQKQE
jgi:hypothetical protein